MIIFQNKTKAQQTLIDGLDLGEDHTNLPSDKFDAALSIFNWTNSDFKRAQRNILLAETDAWALSDRTMTAEQTAYRQDLRDITDQAGFPDTVTWPTKP